MARAKKNPVVTETIVEETTETIVEETTETIVEETTETIVEETTETPPEVPAIIKPTMKVGQRARQLIQEGIMDNKGILATLQAEYPEGKTSIACVAWYRADLKKKAAKAPDPDQGYKDWLKANELRLRAEYEATLVTEEAPV